MKMLIIHQPHQMLHTIQFCLDTGMENGDNGLQRISLTGRGHMLITLETHDTL